MTPDRPVPTWIRRLERPEEYVAAEELQQICWQAEPIEAVPLNLMVTLQHEGGLVLGAFTPEDQLVGFVLGFLGREDGRLKHCSHMAAVLPAYRRQRIVYRLKMAQRAIVLADGLDVMTWTADPLQYPNASLNAAALGAICRTYKREVYGNMRMALNGALPTDRLYWRWELASPRVEECARTGEPARAPVAPTALTDVDLAGAAPRLRRTREPAGPLVGIQIPRRLHDVLAHDAGWALEWRQGTRVLFEAAFAAGYTVVNFTADPDVPEALGRYTLARPA